MKQRNILVTIFSLILIASFVWLGGVSHREEGEKQKNSVSGTDIERSRKEKDPKIGVSIYRYDDIFMKIYRFELKQYLEEEYHAKVIIRNAGGDRDEQKKQIDQFIFEGCDGIIINPVDAADVGTFSDLCFQGKTPLVLVNTEVDEKEAARWEEKDMPVSLISTNSRQAGTYQGQIILESKDQGDKNGDGIISYALIKGEKDSEASEYRCEYAIKALRNAGKHTVELFSENGDWSRESGKKLAESALSVYGKNIEVIFCSNDAMANGALDAVKELGLIPGKEVDLVGVDALQNTVQSIKDGQITGTVLNDHQGQSRLAADTLIKRIKGEPAKTTYLVDYIKITVTSTLNH